MSGHATSAIQRISKTVKSVTSAGRRRAHWLSQGAYRRRSPLKFKYFLQTTHRYLVNRFVGFCAEVEERVSHNTISASLARKKRNPPTSSRRTYRLFLLLSRKATIKGGKIKRRRNIDLNSMRRLVAPPTAAFRSRFRSVSFDHHQSPTTLLVPQLIQQCDPPREPKGGGAGVDVQQRHVGDIDLSAISPEEQQKLIFSFRKVRVVGSSVGGKQVHEVEWQCSQCSWFNFLRRAICRRCRASCMLSKVSNSALPQRHIPSLPSKWVCNAGSCRHVNQNSGSNPSSNASPSQRRSYFCESCQAPFGGLKPWRCPTCSRENTSSVSQCMHCFAEQPFSWTCASCREHANSIFTSACVRCGTKPEVKPAAPACSPVFCPSCAFPNAPASEICTSCCTPLPCFQEQFLGRVVVPAKQEPTATAPASAVAPVPESPPEVTLTHSKSSSAAPPAVEVHPHNNNINRVEPSSAPASQNQPPASSSPPQASSTTDSKRTAMWTCRTCGAPQRAVAQFCDNCLTTRMESDKLQEEDAVRALSGDLAANKGSKNQVEALWICANCHHANPRGATCCAKCADKDAELSTDNNDGRWVCSSCQAPNAAEQRFCTSCDAKRVLPASLWQCSVCSSVNSQHRVVCIGCQTSIFSSNDLAVVSSLSDVRWVCGNCGGKNFPKITTCYSCGGESSVWLCPCAQVNSLDDLDCVKCHAKRTTFHKCSVCRSPVDLSSSTCAVCQSPTSSGPLPISKVQWLCNLCGSANSDHIRSCTRCLAERTEDCASLPQSWDCDSCHTSNSSLSHATCRSCQAPRRVDWDLPVQCPQCQATTRLTSEERCSSCNASLSEVPKSFLWRLDFDSQLREDSTSVDLTLPQADNELTQMPGARDTHRPAAEEIGAVDSSRRTPPEPNQWICTLCGKQNTATSTECLTCGIPKDV